MVELPLPPLFIDPCPQHVISARTHTHTHTHSFPQDVISQVIPGISPRPTAFECKSIHIVLLAFTIDLYINYAFTYTTILNI